MAKTCLKKHKLNNIKKNKIFLLKIVYKFFVCIYNIASKSINAFIKKKIYMVYTEKKQCQEIILSAQDVT